MTNSPIATTRLPVSEMSYRVTYRHPWTVASNASQVPSSRWSPATTGGSAANPPRGLGSATPATPRRSHHPAARRTRPLIIARTSRRPERGRRSRRRHRPAALLNPLRPGTGRRHRVGPRPAPIRPDRMTRMGGTKNSSRATERQDLICRRRSPAETRDLASRIWGRSSSDRRRRRYSVGQVGAQTAKTRLR